MGLLIGLDEAPPAGKYSELQPEARKAVDQWVANLTIWQQNERRTRLPIGLWVQGPRASGTTFTASVAVKMVVRSAVYETFRLNRWEYITYADLNDLVRESWSAAPRNHTDDMSLYQEAAELDSFLSDMWRHVDLLWIDDVLHTVTDMSFFEKYVLSEIVARLKRGLPVVVSTSLNPSELGPDLIRVLTRLFVDCVVSA